MKRTLVALGLLAATALAVPTFEPPAQAEPASAPVAQAQPTQPFRPPATPTRAPGATTTTAPRAGGFPMQLAFPLLAGGAAALGAGAYLLRRGKK